MMMPARLASVQHLPAADVDADVTETAWGSGAVLAEPDEVPGLHLSEVAGHDGAARIPDLRVRCPRQGEPGRAEDGVQGEPGAVKAWAAAVPSDPGGAGDPATAPHVGIADPLTAGVDDPTRSARQRHSCARGGVLDHQGPDSLHVALGLWERRDPAELPDRPGSSVICRKGQVEGVALDDPEEEVLAYRTRQGAHEVTLRVDGVRRVER